MTTFASNFAELLKTRDEKTQEELSPIEQQLFLAEMYITEKRKKCAKYALLIVHELLLEGQGEGLKKRYNQAVESFNSL